MNPKGLGKLGRVPTLGGSLARHVVLAVALAAILAPPALGATALRVTTEDPVDVVGAASVALPGGTLEMAATGVVDTVALANATGELTVWTWTQARGSVRAVNASVLQSTGDATSTVYALEDAEVALTLAGEWVFMVVAAEEGTLVARGALATSGRPVLLPTSLDDEGPPAATFKLPWHVPRSWPAGSFFVGEYDIGGIPLPGFPTLDGPRLGISGTVSLELGGGNLSFADASGAPHTIRLGAWTDPSEGGFALREGGFERRAFAVFNGTVEEADAPLTGAWGIAGPRLEVELEGVAEWTRADVSGERDGEDIDVRDSPVRAEGRLVLAPTSGAAIGPDTWDLGGDVTTLRIGGAPIAPASVPEAAEQIGLVALLLGALGLAAHFGLGLYTRIASDRLLDNPNRRAIYDRVMAQPGIHQRELHRAAGGAWGPFTFHLRLLREAGYVRVEDQGRYKLVFPAGANPPTPAGAAIPHPVTRAVFEAVPGDGAIVAFSELRDRLGLSRQLLSYHLRTLETRGLVVAVRTLQEERGVKRAGARGPAAPRTP